LIRKGIRTYGQRHQIKPFSRASLTDQSKNYDQHGYLERSCLVANLLTEMGRGNNRQITDRTRAIRQIAPSVHHRAETPTAQLPVVS
jgi:hypothetical protein